MSKIAVTATGFVVISEKYTADRSCMPCLSNNYSNEQIKITIEI
jgi:hypothetical protein